MKEKTKKIFPQKREKKETIPQIKQITKIKTREGREGRRRRKIHIQQLRVSIVEEGWADNTSQG